MVKEAIFNTFYKDIHTALIFFKADVVFCNEVNWLIGKLDYAERLSGEGDTLVFQAAITNIL